MSRAILWVGLVMCVPFMLMAWNNGAKLSIVFGLLIGVGAAYKLFWEQPKASQK